jgi:hypothetical protein
MKSEERRDEALSMQRQQVSAHQLDGSGPAWEEVATGRYMPRRIKGSCKGRALG